MPTTTKPKITRLPDTTVNEGFGRDIVLRHYAVNLNGEVIGKVGQMRSETMQRYSGRMYGYATRRTTWYMETEFCGDYDLDTRAAAVQGVMDDATS